MFTLSFDNYILLNKLINSLSQSLHDLVIFFPFKSSESKIYIS